MVYYFTSLTLISEPPTFLTQWGGGVTRVLRQGIPTLYDVNDDDDMDNDGDITAKLHEDVVILTLLI
jgi:hypothetical protein